MITLNVPHISGENDITDGTADSRHREVLDKMGEMCKYIMASLEIKDWGLFGA